MVITAGIRVVCRDAEWLVKNVSLMEGSDRHHIVHCVGVDDLVRGHEGIFITQLDKVVPVNPRKTELVADSSSGYRMSKLFLEAQLRQMPAAGIEPDFTGMGIFQLLKFQEWTVRKALEQLRPRLLLADAVGLGKTIQVGMILTELLRRGRANRILVLAKKSMLTQFQAELWNRFNIPLVRLDSVGIAKLRLRVPANKNPFEVYHRLIISLDTLKNVARYEHFLRDARWDVVVIDEAHNVAGASVPERHLSYRLARLLSNQTESMLLTTATPHNGKRETFGRLINLLDPAAIPDPYLREYTAEHVANFFLMRFKEDVREDAGGMLMDREVVPPARTRADATPGEERVYEILAELREQVRSDASLLVRVSGDGKANRLTQYGYYKQFLSSPESCRETVGKRIRKLREEDPAGLELLFLEKLHRALEGLSIERTSRFQLLVEQLRAIGWDGSSASPRVLLFTEYRQTQEHLARALAKHFRLDYSDKFENQSRQALAQIHGSTPDIHLMSTVEAFATGAAPLRLLVATDVASEGINLHHECHNIIHYDLPWSIITLIQRNGRIDRLGQKKKPVIRYLMVDTKQGLLEGDRAIFERLVQKVEEINRLRQSGESVLKLYDPEAEEEYLAREGILPGNLDVLEKSQAAAASETGLLEEMLRQCTQNEREEMRRMLLGQEPADAGGIPEIPVEKRVRFYPDREFLLEGYRYLAEQNRDYLPIQVDGPMLTLTAPKDLKRRLGAPDERGDVIFGSTAIPGEAWPEHDQFRLTDIPGRVEQSILAARQTTGYWARELLCNEQHPILQWVVERLLMQLQRYQAPFILSQALEPGVLSFCFIGQVSSLAGRPLVVEAHAITYRHGGTWERSSLAEALRRAQFGKLINTGITPNLEAARLLIHSAVEQSLEYMRQRREAYDDRIRPPLGKEERRLRLWKTSRRELLGKRLAELGEGHPQARKFRRQLEEMEDYLQKREQDWRNTHLFASDEPSTQLILVIGGVKE